MPDPRGFWASDGRVARELRLRVLLLDAVPLFQRCSARELEELAAVAHPVAFQPGEVLCVEGDDSDVCYVIFAGEALATADDRPLGMLGPNDVVGEVAPLFDVPRRATVSALSHVLAYAISASHLRRLAAANPDLGCAMRAEVARRYHP